jgi:hypothetical protein
MRPAAGKPESTTVDDPRRPCEGDDGIGDPRLIAGDREWARFDAEVAEVTEALAPAKAEGENPRP